MNTEIIFLHRLMITFAYMKVYTELQQIPAFKNAIITIGTFDGVHEGHKKILNQLISLAKKVQGQSVVITFNPHPRNIVGDTTGVKLLTTLPEKIELLEKQGIDNLVIVPFNNSFSNLSADEYITEFLYKIFNPHTLIIGYDHHFGKDRKGNYKLLELYAQKLGFTVQEIDEKIIAETAISSTRVRKALLQADLPTANNLLGYNYFFEGIVIEGDKLGRTIGYPTANLQLNNEDKLVPADGVYAVTLTINHVQEFLQGMMYIGSRPVVNGKRRVIEINIFNFNKDIYSQTITVSIKHYTRGDMNFANLEALKTQLAIDKINCQKLLTF